MDTGANSFSQGRLPDDVTSFVGRQRATTHVRRLLSETRLITLTGVGGGGKSRLALHVARQVRRAFPDGVWLVELVKLGDPALVASAVMAAIGLTDTSETQDACGACAEHPTGPGDMLESEVAMNAVPDTFSQGRLPVDATSFVGRRRAATQVRNMLSESRLVTLVGVGGVGKSRLALRVASELRRAFPDGVWLVELAKLEDPDLVASAVTAALGLPDSTSREPAEGLIDYLADKRLLLILDNCEHLLAACARLLARVLPAVPGVRALVTSREPLGIDGEQIWQVPPLSVPDSNAKRGDARQYEAMALFEDRAAAVRPGFRIGPGNRLAVARLCRRLDGLPLAIELAAAVWLRKASVDQILARLRDRLPLPAAEDAPLDRHRTLLATIEWSFDLCSEAERRLWARLSVFAGEFDLDAADAVCGLDGLDVLVGITGLVDKSILVRGGDEIARYRMLDTIRHYGAERLADTGERDTLRRRHRDHYLSLVERADANSCGPQLAEWTARLRADRADLWAALDYCLTEPGESRTGLHMAAAMWPYWVACGYVRDGRHWLDRALALDTRPGRERAHALWVDGWIAFLQGDSSASLLLLEESLALTLRLGADRDATYALQHLGSTLLARGQDAVPILDEALAWHRESGEWTAIGLLCLVQRAEVAIVAGDLDLALGLLDECAAICEPLGELFARSWAEWDLGMTWWRVGDLENALAHLNEAARRMLDVGDQLGFPFCIEVLGWVAVSAGHPRRAAVLFGAADRGWSLIGMPLFRVETFLGWRDESRRRCRGQLGERAFETAHRKGVRLAREEVAAIAFGEEERTPETVQADRVLTKREEEIAEMIAQGMSNRDIAAALVIAQRTVEGHVGHMLSKLGFGSRAQIAAWIAERQDRP